MLLITQNTHGYVKLTPLTGCCDKDIQGCSQFLPDGVYEVGKSEFSHRRPKVQNFGPAVNQGKIISF